MKGAFLSEGGPVTLVLGDVESESSASSLPNQHWLRKHSSLKIINLCDPGPQTSHKGQFFKYLYIMSISSESFPLMYGLLG